VSTFLARSLVGLGTGCVDALTATGPVVTHPTAGVVPVARGAMGIVRPWCRPTRSCRPPLGASPNRNPPRDPHTCRADRTIERNAPCR
jgi:hypothetical protein